MFSVKMKHILWTVVVLAVISKQSSEALQCYVCRGCQSGDLSDAPTQVCPSRPPPTPPSTTEASTTVASTTDASTTDASTTEASTTEASSTEASTTIASTTEASTTEASTTEASTTEASTTEASTTEASTTEASTTEASTTEASTTEASTTEASTTEASTTEASTTEASTTEASTTDASKNIVPEVDPNIVPQVTNFMNYRAASRDDSENEGAPRCFVTYFEVNGEADVIRGCAYADDDAEGVCRNAVDESGAEIKDCRVCDGELCNSSTRTTVGFLILLLSVIVHLS